MPYNVDDKYEYITYIEWIVPPGCTPRTNSSGFRRYGRDYTVWNEPQHRPYPSDPLAALTGLSYQVTQRIRGVKARYIVEHPCSHGGIHGSSYEIYHARDPLYYSPRSTGLHDTNQWSQKIREKIEDQNVNLGTTLAEYRASADMFGSFAKGVRNAYQVLRGKRKRKKLRVCSIPAAHLQYSYGIGPLASDLFDTQEALRLALQKPLVRRVVSTSRERLSGTAEIAWIHDRWRSVQSQRAIFYVEYDVDALQPIHFGNPIEWAWERIPFSFVVDWGIPIGEWLHSLDALKGVNSVKGTVTTKVRYWGNLTATGGYHQDQKGYFKQESHVRDVHNSIPLPSPPKWDPSKSWRTVANGLALLGVLNKRCKR